MSHDLRTPMDVITGYTRILLHKAGNVLGQYRDLEYIQTSADSLLVLISDILAPPKIGAGHMDIRSRTPCWQAAQ